MPHHPSITGSNHQGTHASCLLYDFRQVLVQSTVRKIAPIPATAGMIRVQEVRAGDLRAGTMNRSAAAVGGGSMVVRLAYMDLAPI